MNRDDIIRMAVDAGIIPWTKHEYVGGKNFSASDEGLDGDLASLIQFAELVASAEREACAKVCEDAPEPDGADLAERIRARGNVATNDTSQKRVDKTSEIVHEAQPEQEPVKFEAVWDSGLTNKDYEDAMRLKRLQQLTTPPQRTWVGLTDEEISELIRATHNTGSFVRAIEAKLKEKNT